MNAHTAHFPTTRRNSFFRCEQKEISEVVKSYGLHIPPYQRPYSWDKERVQDFVGSVTETMDLGQDRMHMMSACMIHQRNGSNGPYHDVIDGQQRVTTFMLALATIAREARKSKSDEKAKKLADRITNSYLFDDFDEDIPAGQARIRLTHSMPSERKTFLSICLPHTAVEDLDTKHTMVRACKTIAQAMRAHCMKRNPTMSQRDPLPCDYLNEFFGVVVRGLEIMVIVADEKAQVNRLFEDLNSKGQGLSQVDLIRNHFAQNIPDGEFVPLWDRLECIRREIDDRGDRFIAYWMLARFGVSVGSKRLHRAFCLLVEKGVLKPTKLVLEGMIQDAERMRVYRNGTDIHGTPVDGLAWLARAKASQHLPTLMAADRIEAEKPEVFADICNEIAKTVLVTTMADGGNARYEHSWVRWAKDITKVSNEAELAFFLNSENGMRSVRKELQSKLEAALEESGRHTIWAKDRPKANDAQWNCLAYGALAIERAIGNTETAASFLAKTTLEHIVPVRSAHAHEAPASPEGFRKMVSALGNLTILLSNENSSASNRPLIEKRAMYAASGVAMTRGLVADLAHDTSRAKGAELLHAVTKLPNVFDADGVEKRGKSLSLLLASVLVA